MKKSIRFFPHTLRFQLLSRSLILLAVLFLIIGVLQFIIMQQFMFRYTASTISGQIRSIPPYVWQLLRFKPTSDLVNSTLGRMIGPETSLVVVDWDGRILATRIDKHRQEPVTLLSVQEYQALLAPDASPEHYKVLKNAKGASELIVLQRVNMHKRLPGLVQFSTSLKPLNDVLERTIWTYVAGAAVALFLGIILYVPLLRRTLSPLSNVVRTVERIKAGNLSERLPVRQKQDEVNRLAYSFNEMLERIEASFNTEKEAREQMRRFIADASHELRTPLTSIHGFLEVLLRGAADRPEQLHTALNSMLSESERLTKLVNDLLLLTRLDRQAEIQMSPGRLADVVYEIEPSLRLLAGTRRVDIETDIEGLSTFDRDKMKQVILNLFQNAVQHTDSQKGRIKVKLCTGSVKPEAQTSNKSPSDYQGIVLSVQDNGPGIPEAQLSHLFERFYRGEYSRARQYGGTGLGLAIVESIVISHGGRVWVESRVGEGAIFHVWLPPKHPKNNPDKKWAPA